MFKKFALLTTVLALASTAAQADSTELFTGASFTPSSYYTYLGGVYAFNRDLKEDGFLARASAAYGGYDYSRPGSTRVDGNVTDADFMLGYQKFVGPVAFIQGARLTGYVGGDYQDQDLSPSDPKNRVSGSEYRLKGQLEADLFLTDKVDLNTMGSYSGAFDTYWSKAQLGYNLGYAIVGPEAAFMGSQSYDQQRYGVFARDIAICNVAKLGLSGGYENSARRGSNGGYGEAGLTFSF